MSIGLIAILDDVAALAKAAAASIDDIVAQAGKAGVKAAGVVIDDTAVTPRYVAGLAPSRELPIVARIAMGSLRNKLLFLLPSALALSLFAPWAITPLLMLGGAYLCFEGTEKVLEAIWPHGPVEAAMPAGADPVAFEEAKVAGAIRTDFILSAEIMALTLASVPEVGFVRQAIVLAVVGIGITLLVYGAVAVIVKLDDVGLVLAGRAHPVTQLLGRLMVRGMAPLLVGLSVVGTAAMLWVGGGILLHGLELLGEAGPAHAVAAAGAMAGAAVPAASAVVAWLAASVLAGLLGVAVGLVMVLALGFVVRPAMRVLRRR